MSVWLCIRDSERVPALLLQTERRITHAHVVVPKEREDAVLQLANPCSGGGTGHTLLGMWAIN